MNLRRYHNTLVFWTILCLFVKSSQFLPMLCILFKAYRIFCWSITFVWDFYFYPKLEMLWLTKSILYKLGNANAFGEWRSFCLKTEHFCLIFYSKSNFNKSKNWYIIFMVFFYFKMCSVMKIFLSHSFNAIF